MAVDETTRETAIGGAVLAAAALILALSYSGGGPTKVVGYDLTARFHKAEGISTGSEVRLSGVVIGRVVGEKLDDRYRAVVTLRMTPETRLPTDSSAIIQTDGLLGSKFISLQPGGDETDLKPGDEIRFTQDSLNVNDLLGMIIAEAEARRGGATPVPGAPKPAAP
jgi:phospholipid/cholesterol/gamma-HCH transport system substrate-binding protein